MDQELDELFRSLLEPSAFPDGGEAVHHIETHISHVYLVGDYAYKLKKQVDFGFVDFSTRQKRQLACDDELRLNRRLAPDWYIDVVPVCLDDGQYFIRPQGCGHGQRTESAVRMRRLPAEGLLDRLATKGRLPVELMDDIARQIATFHARANHGPEMAGFGTPEAIAKPAIQNFEQTKPFIGRVFDAGQHRRLHEATIKFLGEHRPQFEIRQAGGHIVDGHGDLHLRNMCRAGDQVVIFDCIEFNPALRAGDAISDIAFLTMDLDHRGLTGHRNRFLNEYLEQGGDYQGLALLDYYQAYRACVRAKVSSLELDQDPGLADEANAYFGLAERYFAPSHPGLLMTCGLSGSGKSTVARQLAEITGSVVVRSDAVRKRLAGTPLRSRGDASIYTPAMTTRTYSRLRDHARDVITSGRWVILDAVHGLKPERAAAAEVAHRLGVPFGIVYCEAPPAELRARLARRVAAGPDVSDADVAVLERQTGFFEKPDNSEGPLVTWTGGAPPVDWLRDLGWRPRD